MLDRQRITTLLVEDDAVDARLVREMLSEASVDDPALAFDMTHVTRLDQALRALAEGAFQVVLLDLGLPDSQGLDTLHRTLGAAQAVPVLVLSGLGDRELALEAVTAGARDYLVKGRIDEYSLPRAVHHAIERQRAEEALRRYIERLKNLHKIDRAILAAHSPGEIADTALRHLLPLVPFQWATTIEFDLEARQAAVLAIYVDGASLLEPGTRFPLNLFTDVKELRQRKVRIVNERAYFRIEIPLLARNELIGLVTLGVEDLGTFTPDHEEVAHEVASSLAIAIQQARLHQQVRAAGERLRTLSRRLVEAQENERRRIARELHDEVGQALTTVIINLQTLQRLLDAPRAEPCLEPRLERDEGRDEAPDPPTYLEESLQTVRRTLQQVRDMSLDLRPSLLDDLGLAPALRWYTDRQAQRGGLTVHVAADLPETRLPVDVETTCFRVVQEALTNVISHAQAQRVSIELRRGQEGLELSIRDDGRGFDVQRTLRYAAGGASLGLLGMQERIQFAGGQIDIQSAPGHGTEIRVSFPANQL
jgi:signal transduction histidine kinase